MNFRDASRGWEKSKVGDGMLRADRWLGVERKDRETCPSTLEQQHATLLSFFKRATAPTLRSCKGVINLPCNDVITLMDTGLVAHFISTRAFYVVSSSLYTTSRFPQPPSLYQVTLSPFLIPLGWGGKKALLEIIGLASRMRCGRQSHLWITPTRQPQTPLFV